jgi:hypothetical protein
MDRIRKEDKLLKTRMNLAILMNLAVATPNLIRPANLSDRFTKPAQRKGIAC